MKEYRLITFICNQCGIKIKALIRSKEGIIFDINDKLYSPNDVLSELGYYVCIICKSKQDIRFEYIYR